MNQPYSIRIILTILITLWTLISNDMYMPAQALLHMCVPGAIEMTVTGPGSSSLIKIALGNAHAEVAEVAKRPWPEPSAGPDDAHVSSYSREIVSAVQLPFS